MKQHRKKRSAYTLIELLAAMAAASILLASLAATVIVSTNLLETPTQEELLWRNRDISDRIATDLRYSTAIDETPANGFQVTKASVSTGADETAIYEAYTQGLTRQIDSGSVVQLDENGPSHTFNVDGFSAPTYIPSTVPVRVRSSSSSAEEAPVSAVSCDYPPGCQDGDIVVMAVASNATSVATANGWSTIQYLGNGTLRFRIFYQSYDSATPGPAQVVLNAPSEISVAMILLENASETDPSNWSSFSGGFATASVPASHPQPLLRPATTEPHHLNINILAAVGNPWPNNTQGVASYDDVVASTTAAFSVGIIVRSGPRPEMTTIPTYWHQIDGAWAQSSLRVGNGG